LGIRDSKKITLFNCVVLGDLHIGSHEGIRKIRLDNCLVLGTLSISGNDEDPNMKVTVWNSNCTILNISSNKIKDLDVGASNIHDCHFVNTTCESLHMTSNRIRFFRLEDFEVVRCNFFHGQIDLSESFPAKPVRRTREAKDIGWDTRASVLLDFSLGANLQSQSTFETLTFLRNRTFIGGDQRSLSDLRYRAALLSQSKISRFLVRLTGGFESPMHFAAFAAVILIAAALIYSNRFCGFVHNSDVTLQAGAYQIHSTVSWGLSFREALYFSCITFTTIGYGDLTPLGMTRFFAASEGLLGIVVASSFVVALVKRYIGNDR
jgi:Ion channel